MQSHQLKYGYKNDKDAFSAASACDVVDNLLQKPDGHVELGHWRFLFFKETTLSNSFFPDFPLTL